MNQMLTSVFGAPGSIGAGVGVAAGVVSPGSGGVGVTVGVSSAHAAITVTAITIQSTSARIFFISFFSFPLVYLLIIYNLTKCSLAAVFELCEGYT
jgi:hypothetical protein